MKYVPGYLGNKREYIHTTGDTMKKLALENYLTRFMRYVIDWRKTRKIIRTLQDLPDHTLEDMGIRRHDIERLAYTELQRKNYEK
jgi:uncharacterized protein YjiS (DUF1127 family)